MRTFTPTFKIIIFFASIAAQVIVAVAETVLLFGSNGAVGSEVFQALLSNEEPTFWEEVILIGRRFPNIENTYNSETKLSPIKLQSLENIDKDEDLLATLKEKHSKPGACIIAVGAGNPQDMDLASWHAVDVDIIGSITRLCRSLDVHYISLLSSTDATNNPDPISKEEFTNYKDKRLGWWNMISLYMRIKGLSEKAVLTNLTPTGSILDQHAVMGSRLHVSIMQPSNIVTETPRYGWFDTLLFKILPLVDPWLPEKYRSIPVKVLGRFMEVDAREIVRGIDVQSSGITTYFLSYEDFAAYEEYVEDLKDAECEADSKDESNQEETKNLKGESSDL